jgi:hypothetical protein
MFSQLSALLGSSPADGMIAARSPLGTSAYPAGSSVTGCGINESYLNRVMSCGVAAVLRSASAFSGSVEVVLGATTYKLIHFQVAALFFP